MSGVDQDEHEGNESASEKPEPEIKKARVEFLPSSDFKVSEDN